MTRTALQTAPWLMGFDDDRRRIAAAPMSLDQHLHLIHAWMQQPHVVPWWGLDGPVGVTEEYLAEQIGLPHVQPWVASVDGRPFAYVETYLAADDPLAGQLADAGSPITLGDDDRGWHVLVGTPSELGTGAARLLGRSVLRHLFTDPSVRRVVCEPDVRNERMIRFCEAIGHRELDRVDLPAKRAALLAVEREDAT